MERVGRRERVVIRRGRKPVAAVISLKDLRLLEEIEDRLAPEVARKALAEPGRLEFREAFRKSKKDLIHRALEELIRVRRKKDLTELAGRIHLHKRFDHKRLRELRHSSR